MKKLTKLVLLILTAALAVTMLMACREEELIPALSPQRIEAAYTQQEGITQNTALDYLRGGLSVRLVYDDESCRALLPSEFSLSGILVSGQTSVIRVTFSHEGQVLESTFSVEVAASYINNLLVLFEPKSTAFYRNDSLSSLLPYLTIYAVYNDSTPNRLLTEDDFTLSGQLNFKQSRVTATYRDRITAGFYVEVEDGIAQPVRVSISASFEDPLTPVASTATLADLIPRLTVTAHYDDGSYHVIALIFASMLQGELVENTVSTITVTVGMLQATFDVVVEDLP